MSLKEEDYESEENKENKVENKTENVLSNKELIEIAKAELKKELGLSTPANSDATAEAIKQLVTQLKEKPDDEKYGGENKYVQLVDIDKEDRLEQGVTFFSHKVTYVIVDDKREGFPVQTPYKNVIKFDYQSTKKVGSGKEAKLHNLSAYTSFSKKEVAWLKEHTSFGSVFFMSHKEALTVDNVRANKLARKMTVLNRMDTARVIKMANDCSINQMEDMHALRVAIANKQVDEEMAKELEANEIRVKEARIEEELFTKEP